MRDVGKEERNEKYSNFLKLYFDQTPKHQAITPRDFPLPSRKPERRFKIRPIKPTRAFSAEAFENEITLHFNRLMENIDNSIGVDGYGHYLFSEPDHPYDSRGDDLSLAGFMKALLKAYKWYKVSYRSFKYVRAQLQAQTGFDLGGGRKIFPVLPFSLLSKNKLRICGPEYDLYGQFYNNFIKWEYFRRGSELLDHENSSSFNTDMLSKSEPTEIELFGNEYKYRTKGKNTEDIMLVYMAVEAFRCMLEIISTNRIFRSNQHFNQLTEQMRFSASAANKRYIRSPKWMDALGDGVRTGPEKMADREILLSITDPKASTADKSLSLGIVPGEHVMAKSSSYELARDILGTEAVDGVEATKLVLPEKKISPTKKKGVIARLFERRAPKKKKRSD